MEPGIRHYMWLFIKLVILALFFMPFLERAMARDGLDHLYDSPQGLAMGNALTADAEGYAALYYNPAGLARLTGKDRWFFTPIDFEGILGTSAISRVWSTKSFGFAKLIPQMQANPGKFAYYRGTVIPSASRRNFGVAVLDNYYFNAQSDGTNVDIDAGQDIGPSFGGAVAFWGGRVRIGATAKALIRGQLKGVIPHDQLSDETAISSRAREGMGFGADVGLILSAPVRYLPSLGVVWHDVGNTRFTQSKIFNKLNGGAPDPINQSYDAAFSIHPAIAKGWHSTFALSVDHIERKDLPFRKRTHIGFQADDTRNLYLWIGLNRLYLTAGVGYRVSGGDLEIGTYGEEIGTGSETREDRRIFMRYSIGF